VRIRIRFFLVVIAVAASMACHAIIGAVDVSCCREGGIVPAVRRFTPLYLLTTVVTCVALFAAVVHASTNVVILVGSGGFAAVIALGLYTFVASKAAKSADGQY